MVAPYAPQEPTAEFNERCINLLRQWDTGKISSRELLSQLADLSREATSANHAANQGRVEHLQGYVHHYLGNYNTSIMHYEKARRYYVRAGNRGRIATIDLNQGENYRLKGEFSRALTLFRSAYETSESMQHLPMMSFALTNEGLVLVTVKDYENARAALQRAYDLSVEWDRKVYDGVVEEAEALRNEIFLGLAEIELAQNRLSSAWDYACESLRNAQAIEEPRATGLAYRILGDVLTALPAPVDPSMPTSPDDFYRQAMECFKQVQAEGEIGRTVFAHARSLAARRSRLKAAQMFREAMVIFTRLGMTHDAVRAAEAQLKVL
jgi:tetratricopeptide (TPR) repeat protein